MAEAQSKKTTPYKKVRFNEKVQVFLIQTENPRKSQNLRCLRSDWIRLAHVKPLSEKLKEPLNRSASYLGTGHLTPTSEDLINFYLQRKVKQPFTYWDVMKLKANPSLAFTPTVEIPREEFFRPAKHTRTVPNTPSHHQRRFSTFGSTSSPSPLLQRRTFDNRPQFSEILAIYGNNPSLRTNTSQPEFLLKNTQAGEIDDKLRGSFNKGSRERGNGTSAEMFPYLRRPQGLRQRTVQSASSFLYK